MKKGFKQCWVKSWTSIITETKNLIRQTQQYSSFTRKLDYRYPGKHWLHFTRPHFDYGGVIYNQHYNIVCSQKNWIYTTQFCTSNNKSYWRVVLWKRLAETKVRMSRGSLMVCKLGLFYKTLRNKSQKYLVHFIPQRSYSYFNGFFS